MAKYLIALVVSALAGAGCSGTGSATDGGLTIQSIGVCDVTDSTLVPANAASCNVTFNNSAGGDGGAAPSDYGTTMYGSAGDDDDCKYYISWTANPIKENANTFFTVTALRLADMTPATCAGIRPDVSLSISHGAPAPANPSTEIAPGIYQVGPIKFDAPGIWTVRFHLFEECDDGQEDSPHGHAAFYVQVP